ISFSVTAAFKTVMVYLLIIVITSIQMMLTVYRSTLLDLFQAVKRPDLAKPPKAVASAIFALLGLALIGYGYELSGHIEKEFFHTASSMLCSIVTVTYFFFRFTLTWCFYWCRRRKLEPIVLKTILSIAPLAHYTNENQNPLPLN